MKQLDMEKVTSEVERLCIEANYYIGKDVLGKLKEFHAKEESSVAKNILEQIITNDEIAINESVPMCQDTGLVVVFLEIGTEVKIDGNIYDAVNEGVRRGYKNGYLRNSVVRHPLDRVNTQDNTPAVIHTKLVPGSDKVKIIVAPKGGGSENMSVVKMLRPADGIKGIKELVVQTIKNAGGNPGQRVAGDLGLRHRRL